MKYNKIFIIYLVFSMIGSIYAQDNIINEIAKGGKFIVRDEEQNEAMVIEDGNVRFSGTLKLEVLPKGESGNSIVVWDPQDKLLKLQDQSLSTGLTTNIKDESWHTLDYDGLAEDNTTMISASVQSTASVTSNKFSTDFGYILLGPVNEHNWANIYTDQSRFLLNKDLYSFGSFGSYYGNNLIFKTGGDARITILHGNGNVGIGTKNPSAKLEVAGKVKITGGTPGLGKVLTSDGAGLATWQTPATSGSSTLWTESGNNIYRTNGKVGIGTSSPTYNLDVNGTVLAKRYVVKTIYNITSGVWDLSKGNLAQITYNSSITPITINSDGSVGTYILVVKKNTSCTDCNITFSGATVKYKDGVNPTLSNGSNTTDIFSFIAIGNNTFYCLTAKNLL